jgi:hypothetical protein
LCAPQCFCGVSWLVILIFSTRSSIWEKLMVLWNWRCQTPILAQACCWNSSFIWTKNNINLIKHLSVPICEYCPMMKRKCHWINMFLMVYCCSSRP